MYLEPYVKEKNILQLSLFYFGNGLPKRTFIQWLDGYKKYSLKCISEYGVPGSFDQDCYTAVMRIWIRQEMPKSGIRLNYSDIARELGLNPSSWVSRIKKSLKKLSMARYEFVECFIVSREDGLEEITTAFSLFDSTSLFNYVKGMAKRNSQSLIIFPEKIRQNLEAEYYQFLDMAWYKALPSGLSRRLYEYLAKRQYHSINDNFTISEEFICRWLPIKDKHSTNRRKRLKKIADSLINAGYLKKYEFNKKKKQCIYTYTNNKPPQQLQKSQEPKQEAELPTKQLQIIEIQAEKPKKEPQKPQITEIDLPKFKQSQLAQIQAIGPKTAINSKAELSDLISLLKTKRPTNKLKENITEYLEKQGYEYVRWNILYANKNAKKSYTPYLKKALTENWAEEWQEEEKDRIKAIEIKTFMQEQEKKKQEYKAKEQEYLESQKERLIMAISNFEDNNLLEIKWQEAEKSYEPGTIGRSFNIKIKFAKLLCEYLGFSEKLGDNREIVDCAIERAMPIIAKLSE